MAVSKQNSVGAQILKKTIKTSEKLTRWDHGALHTSAQHVWINSIFFQKLLLKIEHFHTNTHFPSKWENFSQNFDGKFTFLLKKPLKLADFCTKLLPFDTGRLITIKLND